MRQSRTRKKVPRGAVLIQGPGGISGMSGHGETCDPSMFSSQATLVQQQQQQQQPSVMMSQQRSGAGAMGVGVTVVGGTPDMGGGECVDCHDFYEIHV